MEMNGKVAIITGAASGIGRALSARFVEAGAKLVMSDRNETLLKEVASELGCEAIACDVANEADIQNLVSATEEIHGPIDIMCSNAGLARGETDHAASASNEDWLMNFNVHVMAQVFAARAVLPSMIERGSGHIINMASAAGLLCQIGDAAYSATKHASVGFSESLAITHADDGIKVSVICPQYVATPLTGYTGDKHKEFSEGVISVEDAVDAIMDGIIKEKFMILTHPQVAGYFRNKAEDHDQWISGMRGLRKKIISAVGSTRLEDMHKLF